MKGSFHHILINIDPKNKKFYKDLFEYLGFESIMEDDEFLGYKGKDDTAMIFVGNAIKNVSGDYDTHGVNHITLGVDKMEDVDEVVDWLKEKGHKPLFGTPRHRPEFAMNEGMTYYQVMFESPDKVLLEVAYTGKK